jgi:hypothetical protein
MSILNYPQSDHILWETILIFFTWAFFLFFTTLKAQSRMERKLNLIWAEKKYNFVFPLREFIN